MNAIRVGNLMLPAAKARLGSMASRVGKAMAVPSPRRNVRLGIRCALLISPPFDAGYFKLVQKTRKGLFSGIASFHVKWQTCDNPNNQLVEAKVVLLQSHHNAVNCSLVIVFQPATEGISKHLLS